MSANSRAATSPARNPRRTSTDKMATSRRPAAVCRSQACSNAVMCEAPNASGSPVSRHDAAEATTGTSMSTAATSPRRT
jgi:hypothetical protein